MIVTCDSCKEENTYPDTVWETVNINTKKDMKTIKANENEALIEQCSNCLIKENAV